MGGLLLRRRRQYGNLFERITIRLDVYLTENGLCKSRSAAQSLISSGGVLVNGSPAEKNSQDISETDDVAVKEENKPRYVGRGGLKLEHALERWDIRLSGKLCVDVGASTGGFTDCMLQNGAARVFAVDVGRGQLDEKLREDSRVVFFEEGSVRGGVGEGLLCELCRRGFRGRAETVGVDGEFVPAATMEEQLEMFGLDEASICDKLRG